MTVWIALLRGVNVGGANKLKMADLAATLDGLGLKNISTYIQSGNVVFESSRTNAAKLAGEIRRGVASAHGMEPHVFVLSQAALQDAASANPYPQADAEPKSLHLFFLDGKPAAGASAALERLREGTERFALRGAVMYLHAPDGAGRSKLAAGAEKALGVAATARNWRTVGKLIAMAQERE